MEHRKKSGFTLIELLIALVIIVIIILISLPSLSNLIKYRRISTTAEALFTAIQAARSESVKSNTNVYMTFTTGDAWCYGLSTSSGCDCSTAGSCSISAVKADNARQITLTTTLPSNTVTFDKTHAAASAAGSVTLTLYGRSELIQISISRMGNVTMCSTGINGYTAC